MNDLLFFWIAILSVVFVLAMWKLGRERLYSAIVVFLILIASVGGKIVPFFGHYTNTGNIFYASAFLATYFLIERFGKREGIRSIWVGALCVTIFTLLVRLSVQLAGSADTDALNQALSIAFNPLPRIAFASITAYIASQSINVYLYIYLRKKMDNKHLWLRANTSNAVAQAVDSVIFFSLAFFGTSSFANIWDIILTGFSLKVGFMMLAAPLLRLNRIQEEEEEGKYISVTLV